MVKKQNCVIQITNSCVLYKITDDIHENIAEDVKTRFDTLNYELDRPYHCLMENIKS